MLLMRFTLSVGMIYCLLVRTFMKGDLMDHKDIKLEDLLKHNDWTIRVHANAILVLLREHRTSVQRVERPQPPRHSQSRRGPE